MGVTSLSTSTLRNNLQRYSTIGASAKAGPFAIEFLVIGGGAGGGGSQSGNTEGGGGGGAGGYRCSVPGETSGRGSSAENPLLLLPGTYSITVGAGGAGSKASPIGAFFNGSNSQLANIVSYGGGAGMNAVSSGLGAQNGGCGGGTNRGATRATGLAGQGYDGGRGTSLGSAGGGGAGGQGVDTTSGNVGSAGGPGLSSSITGSAVTRAGGGGGGGYSAAGGAGGSGGGGNGGGSNAAGTAGAANTGSGGGAAGGATSGSANIDGASGGSGLIVFRTPLQVMVSFSAGVTQTNAVVGTKRVYTVTAAGPTDTFTIS